MSQPLDLSTPLPHWRHILILDERKASALAASSCVPMVRSWRACACVCVSVRACACAYLCARVGTYRWILVWKSAAAQPHSCIPEPAASHLRCPPPSPPSERWRPQHTSSSRGNPARSVLFHGILIFFLLSSIQFSSDFGDVRLKSSSKCPHHGMPIHLLINL